MVKSNIECRFIYALVNKNRLRLINLGFRAVMNAGYACA